MARAIVFGFAVLDVFLGLVNAFQPLVDGRRFGRWGFCAFAVAVGVALGSVAWRAGRRP